MQLYASDLSSLSVSVALATYNGEQYIEEQLQSILEQSLSPMEIVICDDASNDNTFEVLQSYKALDVIRLHRNDLNLGFIKNFEKAISLCKGDVIVLCDQDDVWFPDRLKRIVQLFSEDPSCGLVVTDAIVVDQSLAPMGFSVYSRYSKPDFLPDRTLSSLIKKTQVLGCTVAFRVKFLPYVLPISTQLWGHDHWIVFILGVISRLRMIDEPLMYYRRHINNAGNAAPLENRIDRAIRRMYHNLSLQAYQRDFQRWTDMLDHLESLRGKISTDFSVSDLEKGILQVRKRQQFTGYRLQMRKRHRVFRVLPAFRLLLNGDYARYTPGIRTLFKDIIA